MGLVSEWSDKMIGEAKKGNPVQKKLKIPYQRCLICHGLNGFPFHSLVPGENVCVLWQLQDRIGKVTFKSCKTNVVVMWHPKKTPRKYLEVTHWSAVRCFVPVALPAPLKSPKGFACEQDRHRCEGVRHDYCTIVFGELVSPASNTDSLCDKLGVLHG